MTLTMTISRVFVPETPGLGTFFTCNVERGQSLISKTRGQRSLLLPEFEAMIPVIKLDSWSHCHSFYYTFPAWSWYYSAGYFMYWHYRSWYYSSCTTDHGTTFHGTTGYSTTYHGSIVHGTTVHGTTGHNTTVYGTTFHGITFHGITGHITTVHKCA
ncbi:hypothetical protein Btru_046557 [Bulinus truncatus]|nr:hypothetical protein Btru_046557 [Bulinus truncatus]